MPRVTVAILAYNRPEFLGEAIESALAQTYTDFKLIIYDNCSEKDLKSVVDLYDDPRIVYHRNNKNLGMYGNAAQAVDRCDTEFLGILHDDDKYFPWALERLVEVMDTHPEVGFASSKASHTTGSDDFNIYRERRDGTLYTDMMLAEVTASTNRFPLFSGMLVRSADLRAKNMNFRPDAGPAGDVLFCLECSSHRVVAFGLNAPLIEYRLHPGQESNTETADAWFHTSKRCCDYAVFQRLSGSAIDAIKKRSFYTCLFKYISALADEKQLSIDKINSRRDSLQNVFNVDIPQSLLEDIVSVVSLGSIITAVGRGEAPISVYHARIADLKKIGISVPLKRRLKWFLKYIVWQRWLGRSPK